MNLIDKKRPQDGIQELRYIDPMKMKFVRQEKKTGNPRGNNLIDLDNLKDVSKNAYPDIEEYYIYTPKPNYQSVYTHLLHQVERKILRLQKTQSHMLHQVYLIVIKELVYHTYIRQSRLLIN